MSDHARLPSMGQVSDDLVGVFDEFVSRMPDDELRGFRDFCAAMCAVGDEDREAALEIIDGELALRNLGDRK